MDKVLRASKAGFPCDRNLWYSTHGYAGARDESSQRIFDVGTYLEPLVVEWLRQDGWEVEYNPGSQAADVEVKVDVDGGVLAGHPDCIISRGDLRNVLVDIKTMNDRAFREWRREGTLKSKPQYADQVHIYAQGLRNAGREIEHLGIVGLNKNNSELHIDLFEFDADRMREIVSRAARVLKATGELAEDSPRESWCCSYCEYAYICGLQAKPKVNEQDMDVEYTEDESLIVAMVKLKQARELGKESRDLEAEAKSELDAYVKETGHIRIAGGGLLFSLTERERGTFDSAKFKKEHPDLAKAYTKVSSSVMYEVKEL